MKGVKVDSDQELVGKKSLLEKLQSLVEECENNYVKMGAGKCLHCVWEQ